METIALILAAGDSSRFNKDKIHNPLGGHSESVLSFCLKTFVSHPMISGVLVVINQKRIALYHQIPKDLKILGYTLGGDVRKHSVLYGLKAIEKYNPHKVLIHDAARPFVDQSIITNVIKALDTYEAVDLLVPVVDTLKSNVNGKLGVIDRSNLYQTQTPQGFRFKPFYSLHLSDKNDYTDDISLFLNSDHYNQARVGFVLGSAQNYKITFPGDI